MMHVCCHPAVAPEAQIALMLKLVAGFSVGEIARAFLTSEATIYQRLLRGRKAIAQSGDERGVPDAWRTGARIDALLAALYLLFNAGYALSSGERHISQDICAEAIRLTALIAAWEAVDRPDVEALLALMLLQAARFPARVDEAGDILTLAEQDRGRWDWRMIDAGLSALNASARGAVLSSYHLQAGIASMHCVAPSYAETDWSSILAHYDALLEIDGSSLIRLNRAVAYAMVHGPAAGLETLDAMAGREVLDDYALFHATVGELAARSGDRRRAVRSYRRARALVQSQPERQLLDRRLAHYGNDETSFKIRPENPLTD
jgi:RNA polymerase sigma-70 factor (ECF subfamily)